MNTTDNTKYVAVSQVKKAKDKFMSLLGTQHKLIDTYIYASQKVRVKCLIHNQIFLSKPTECNFINYIVGCPDCGSKKLKENGGRKISSNTKKKFMQLLGKNYKLLGKYITVSTKVQVLCINHDETFLALPYACIHHKRIVGCYSCREIRRRISTDLPKLRLSLEKFKSLASDKYKIIGKYINSSTPIHMKCLSHNQLFWVIPTNCRRKQIVGCKKCWSERSYLIRQPDITRAKAEFKKLLGKNYTLLKYNNTEKPAKLKCIKHNRIFYARPRNALRYYLVGCCECRKVSVPERQIFAYVEKLLGKEKIIHQPIWRDALGRKGIIKPDIVIPHLKLVIEHNGLFHGHSAITGSKEDDQWKHHKRRLRIEKLGYRVIYIWEDDWIKRTQAIKRFIKALLRPDLLKIWDARKLKIKLISNLFANKFFDKYHPQGKTYGSHTYIGLYDLTIKRTVAIMGFSTTSRPVLGKPNTAELTRYASRGRVRGGASRLLAHYIKTHPDIHTIKSFSDNDYFDGGMYPAIGFKFTGDVAPDYSTIWGGVRRNKYYTKLVNLARLNRNGKVIFEAGMTEKECLKYNWVRRCWNSGKKRWIYTTKEYTSKRDAARSIGRGCE